MAWIPKADYEKHQLLNRFGVKAGSGECTRKDAKQFKRVLHRVISDCDNADDLHSLGDVILIPDMDLMPFRYSTRLERWAVGSAMVWPAESEPLFDLLTKKSFYIEDFRTTFDLLREYYCHAEIEDEINVDAIVGFAENVGSVIAKRLIPFGFKGVTYRKALILVLAEACIDLPCLEAVTPKYESDTYDPMQLARDLREVEIKRGVDMIARAMIIESNHSVGDAFSLMRKAYHWQKHALVCWNEDLPIPVDPVSEVYLQKEL